MVVQEIAPASSLTARLHRLVVTVDHKQLGLMYIATALLFLVVAGSMAAVIRAQLAVPNNGLIAPQVFNRLFTMHGTTMVFLVGMPIVAGLSFRGPGMTLRRMPLFVWLMLVVSCMILLALPPLTAAQFMLLLDRFLGAHFFDTQAGGSAVLWQHFFWIFGHPEVYILMIP